MLIGGFCVPLISITEQDIRALITLARSEKCDVLKNFKAIAEGLQKPIFIKNTYSKSGSAVQEATKDLMGIQEATKDLMGIMLEKEAGRAQALLLIENDIKSADQGLRDRALVWSKALASQGEPRLYKIIEKYLFHDDDSIAFSIVISICMLIKNKCIDVDLFAGIKDSLLVPKRAQRINALLVWLSLIEQDQYIEESINQATILCASNQFPAHFAGIQLFRSLVMRGHGGKEALSSFNTIVNYDLNDRMKSIIDKVVDRLNSNPDYQSAVKEFKVIHKM
ncbi:MAG: hypothetical protein WD449_01920 [Candidatus Babeliales bacterium]